MNRRKFLKLSALGGSSMAAAGCRPDPVEELIPMLIPPYDYLPGESIHYATTCCECPAACGLVVRTREGRAIKIEGNPHHPLNSGRTCLRGQATLQGLYNPSRATGPVRRTKGQSEIVAWKKGKEVLAEQLKELSTKPGKEILYLGPHRTGTLPGLIKKWLKGIGKSTYLEFDMLPVHSLLRANESCFDQPEIPHYHLEKAEVLLNFGADFMESWLNPVQLTRDYTRMHTLKNGHKGLFIQVGSHLSMTGSNADQWVSCPPGTEPLIALSLAHVLLKETAPLNRLEKKQLTLFLAEVSPEQTSDTTGISPQDLKKLAQTFNQGGRSLALGGGNAGSHENATDLQIAVNLLNYIAGNINKTVVFGADYQFNGNSLPDIQSAIQKMQTGVIDVVIIENVNPAFALPRPSGFTEALKKVPWVVSFSTENDETAKLAHIHLPTAHSLESWGDSRPRNGIFGLQQPVMSKVPGFDAMELGDLILQLAQINNMPGMTAPSFQSYLKTAWRKTQPEVGNNDPFKSFWKRSLQDGGVFQGFNPKNVTLSPKVLSNKLNFKPEIGSDLTLLPVNSVLHDSNARGGNKPWLLEIPHPVTQIAWDSWVELHPETAIKLGIKQCDLVEVITGQGQVEAPAFIYHGIVPGAIAMPVGMGRTVLFPGYSSRRSKFRFLPVLESQADRKPREMVVGANVMNLLPFKLDASSGDLVLTSSVTVKPTGKKAHFAAVDGQYREDLTSTATDHQTGLGDRSQKGRGFIQSISLDELTQTEKNQDHQLRKRNYTTTREDKHSFYDPVGKNVRDQLNQSGDNTPEVSDTHKWEMIVDLDRCTGCSACVAACYAENNIPVVGKDRMTQGREMSWLRVERYFDHNPETGNLETYFSPQMCAQCDNAGCEPVCPVFATYQTPDGLNAMIYNRCVGTRYCSNNCIFKQRRFNYRTYDFPNPLHLQLNPAVTVREKGVMEKCTFCQQRIREIKDTAKDQNREIKDGELQTACQQVCPTRAITFGNVLDKNSRINQVKSDTRRGYKQLEEMNYQPAVLYLKKINHKHRKA